MRLPKFSKLHLQNLYYMPSNSFPKRARNPLDIAEAHT